MRWLCSFFYCLKIQIEKLVVASTKATVKTKYVIPCTGNYMNYLSSSIFNFYYVTIIMTIICYNEWHKETYKLYKFHRNMFSLIQIIRFCKQTDERRDNLIFFFKSCHLCIFQQFSSNVLIKLFFCFEIF